MVGAATSVLLVALAAPTNGVAPHGALSTVNLLVELRYGAQRATAVPSCSRVRVIATGARGTLDQSDARLGPDGTCGAALTLPSGVSVSLHVAVKTPNGTVDTNRTRTPIVLRAGRPAIVAFAMPERRGSPARPIGNPPPNGALRTPAPDPTPLPTPSPEVHPRAGVPVTPSPQPTPRPAAAPTPVPRYPRSVDIHITEDAYPSNVDIVFGGSVTWINDDADAHSIDDFARPQQYLFNGQMFTRTFDDAIFYGHFASPSSYQYRCDEHAGMEGHITVH